MVMVEKWSGSEVNNDDDNYVQKALIMIIIPVVW